MPSRLQVSARIGDVAENTRPARKFPAMGLLQVFSDVSQGRRWGSDGASLKSVSAFSHDPIAADINLYRYVGNNPLTQIDPSGLQGIGQACWAGDPNSIYTRPVPPAPCLTKDVPGTLQGICKCKDAKKQAACLEKAICNTWHNNWAFYPNPCAQTTWGYWCYEWAWGFKDACNVELNKCKKKWFKTEVQMCYTEGGEVHYWCAITSTETGGTIYIDDGFTQDFPGYVHCKPPACYPNKGTPPCQDRPDVEGCKPPPPYDGNNCKQPTTLKPSTPPPPPPSPPPKPYDGGRCPCGGKDAR